jgi:hypothetical protein
VRIGVVNVQPDPIGSPPEASLYHLKGQVPLMFDALKSAVVLPQKSPSVTVKFGH